MDRTEERPYRAAPWTPTTERVIGLVSRYVRLAAQQRVEASELAQRHEQERTALAQTHSAQIIELAHELGGLAETRIRLLEHTARGHKKHQTASPIHEEAA